MSCLILLKTLWGGTIISPHYRHRNWEAEYFRELLVARQLVKWIYVNEHMNFNHDSQLVFCLGCHWDFLILVPIKTFSLFESAEDHNFILPPCFSSLAPNLPHPPTLLQCKLVLGSMFSRLARRDGLRVVSYLGHLYEKMLWCSEVCFGESLTGP